MVLTSCGCRTVSSSWSVATTSFVLLSLSRPTYTRKPVIDEGSRSQINREICYTISSKVQALMLAHDPTQPTKAPSFLVATGVDRIKTMNRFQANVHCILKFTSLQRTNDSETQPFVPYSKRFCLSRYTCGGRGKRAEFHLSMRLVWGSSRATLRERNDP